MNESMLGTLLEFLLLYWLHSSVILGLVLLAVYCHVLKADLLGESVLKGAMLMGLFTAALSMLDTQKTTQLLPEKQVIASPLKQPISRPEASSKHPPKSTPVAKKTGLDHAPIKGRNWPQQTAHNQPWQFSVPWSQWLLVLWALGILAVFVAKAVQLYRLRRVLHDRLPVESETALNIWRRLLHTAGMKPNVQLSESAVIASPMALTHGEVVLPLDFVQDRPQPHVEAALAHELAHIKRKDGLWLWIRAAFATVFFFQPLNRLIGHRINQFAEQRSDALAAHWTGDPRSLAEALASVAHNHFYSTQWVSAMKSNPMNLVTRIEQLVKQNNQKTPRMVLLCAALTLLTVITYSPGFVIEYAAAGSQHNRVSVEDDGHITTLKISSKDEARHLKLTAELAGEIQFNADETEITVFPNDSEFDLRVEQGGVKRRLQIESDGGQALYTYHENGDERPYDAAAKQWFAQIMPELFRITGLDAKARVKTPS